jgi:hypothetical protein
MEPPIYWVVVGANGSMSYGHFVSIEGESGLDCRKIARHMEGGGFALPLTMYFSDRSGNAEKMTVRTPVQ